ncbi:MAG: hypothetical protein OSB62_08330 [Alphaproteobacteria bacterium]|nr:hypothetical protein [Alphaproteobacteria bacterium]
MHKFLLPITATILISFKALAACPAAPVGTANDPTLQMKLNGDSISRHGPANIVDATEEGAMVWDDTKNQVAICNGTKWMLLGAELPSCAVSETLVMAATGWVCGS